MRAAAGSSGWAAYVRRLQGSTLRFDLARYGSQVEEIAKLEDDLRLRSDAEIRRTADVLRVRARGGETLLALRTPAYAVVREAARRVLGERAHDEQVIAALALDDGTVVEMQTGEGKTLAAVMPAVLNALRDRGAHVLTFNDYLARRDAAWMGPIYGLLGLSVGCVQQGMSADARQVAYTSDVTYVTAKEAGFDHLRDLLARNPGDVVHRAFHFALVDEADSLMIDEARVPLVIAGSEDREASLAPRLASLVASFLPEVHFDTDEYGRDVELTDRGVELAEQVLGAGGLHAPGNLQLLTELNCALHAWALLRRDVDYIVRNGRIELVDDFTGRVVSDRYWPDGLQAALEAKEGLLRRPDGRILGTITLQRFFRGYPRLCGMTGTAQGAAAELHESYGLEVVVVPTHHPGRRVDHEDLIYSHREAKERAAIHEIQRANREGRPVLVGTASVSDSERLARALQEGGIACAVLNARNDEDEGRIVANAGALAAVTISTNMAGRGTDIRLGGAEPRDVPRVAARGGLIVIGTNRHESRRVDMQLRGRAGRQGDPGESRVFVSLDDELLARYGIGDLLPSRFFEKSGRPITNPVVRREVARAQRIVEGQNVEIRRTLARYSAVVEEQHRILMERRHAVLTGEEQPDIWPSAGERYAALVSTAGGPAVFDAERQVALACIDRAWSDHLAFCADVREGIHLVRLAGQDPLTAFTRQAIEAFSQIDETIDRAVLEALDNVRAVDGRVDLSAAGITAPAATWTYLVNDDPFKSRIGALLTGPGGVTVAMYSAAVVMPLLILWGLVERLLGRGSARRGNPFGQ